MATAKKSLSVRAPGGGNPLVDSRARRDESDVHARIMRKIAKVPDAGVPYIFKILRHKPNRLLRVKKLSRPGSEGRFAHYRQIKSD